MATQIHRPNQASASFMADRSTPTVGVWWIRRQLGKTSWGESRILSYLQLLIQERDFPTPIPDMVLGRGKPHRLVDGLTIDSQWRRAAVLAWMDDGLPPANAAQIEGAAKQAAANDMDAAAGALTASAGARK